MTQAERAGQSLQRLQPASASGQRSEAPSAPFALSILAVAVALVGIEAARADAAPITLADCVERAVSHAPAVRGGAEALRAARHRVHTAQAAYLPRLVGRGEYGHSWGFDEVVTDGGRSAALLTAEFAVLDGGQRDADLEAARARVQSAEAVERVRRANVALAVRTAYWSALSARAESEIFASAIDELGGAVALLTRQEERGLVVRDDVIRAESALETMRGAQRASSATADAALRELRLWIGVAVTPADLVEPQADAFVPANEEALDNTPALADARAQADASHREVDAVRSEWWGRFGIVGNGGFLGVDPGETFQHNAGGDFLLGYVVPIFDGGAIRSRVAAAEAMAASLDANVAEVRQTTEIALGRIQADATRAAADLEAWRRAAPRAVEGFNLARARYLGGGNVRLLEVLDALSQSIDARVAVTRARLAYETARSTQDQVLGRSE